MHGRMPLLGGTALLAGIALALTTATVGAQAPGGSTTPTSTTATTPASTTPRPCPGSRSTVGPNGVNVGYTCEMSAPPTILTPPAHGRVQIASCTPGPCFSYWPDPGYEGVDTFTWGGAAAGPVTHTFDVVAPGPERCHLAEAPGRRVQQGGSWSVTVNCPDGHDRDGSTVRIVRAPERGTLTTYHGLNFRSVRYIAPDDDYEGPDTFAVQVVDSRGRTSPVLETSVEVVARNRPPVCAPIEIAAPTQAPVPFRISCTDPEGDRLLYWRYGEAQHGTVRPVDGANPWSPDFTYDANDFEMWSGIDRSSVSVHDEFNHITVPITVTVGDGERPRPSESVAPPVASPGRTGGRGRAAPTLPGPPDGFAPARGAALGEGVAVWSPDAGVSLGRRGSPVLATGCLDACAIEVQLRLVPRGRAPVTLPAQTVRLSAGRRGVVSMRLTAAARNATRAQRRVRAVLVLTTRTRDGRTVRERMPLVVSIRKSARPR